MTARVQELQFQCIEHINALVLCKGDEADKHRALELVRAHLDARHYQTRPVGSTLPEPTSYETAQRSVLERDLDEEVI